VRVEAQLRMRPFFLATVWGSAEKAKRRTETLQSEYATLESLGAERSCAI